MAAKLLKESWGFYVEHYKMEYLISLNFTGIKRHNDEYAIKVMSMRLA